MMHSLEEKFYRASDKFRFVVECVDFYRSAETYSHCMSFFESLLKRELLFNEYVDVQLGIIFVKRTLPGENAEHLLNILQNLRPRISSLNDLELKFRIVQSGVRLLKQTFYSEAKTELEELNESLKDSHQDFLYGLVCKTLAAAYMYVGDHVNSEICFQNALSVFHRFDSDCFYAFTLNDYAVLKKKECEYSQAEKLLHRSAKLFDALGVIWGKLVVNVNLGVVAVKTGNWTAAQYYYDRAFQLRDSMIGENSASPYDRNSKLHFSCDTHLEHLLLLRRQFDAAINSLDNLCKKYETLGTEVRLKCLVLEFLGEIYIEKHEYDRADACLNKARLMISGSLPASDMMTEISRRIAYLHYLRDEFYPARQISLECIRLCKKLGDKHELGAVLGILGQLYAKKADEKRATACFETAIHILKSIHESYELMRCCIAYGTFLVDRERPDAEIYLMEARQLCRKLEIDYFMARINVERARLAVVVEHFTEARERLAEAENIYDALQSCDQKQLKPLIDRTSRELDRRILKKSMTAAEEMKTICRVYEEARFPMDDIKPDLAYQVAQSVGAESLFLIKRYGRGYSVPIAYNISINDAREIVRRLDRDSKKPILGIEKDAMIFSLHTGSTLICVPGHTQSGYVLCTQVAGNHAISPAQFERLFASVEALERLAECDVTDKPALVCDEFIVTENSRKITHPRGSFKDILTIDPEMMRIIRLAERASLTDATILLEGETGVGKELFARAIHANSPRSKQSFVAINAGGLPVNLIESQLFGHVKGAFTDAVTDREGLIENARGGTIFLDEVGEMGPELQVKLLRILENGEYRRLGENHVRMANVRVISATNRDLLHEVNRGTFRRDLYYRLGTVKLQIPALRYRQPDIELLLRHFLKQCSVPNHQANRYFEIDLKAMEAMELYDWPGNVRELQNEIMRIVSLIGENDLIRFGMLSQPIKDYIRSKNRREGLLERSVDRYERRLILEALNKNDWNRLRTAEKLGLPRTTLIAKMRRLNISAKQSYLQ